MSRQAVEGGWQAWLRRARAAVPLGVLVAASCVLRPRPPALLSFEACAPIAMRWWLGSTPTVAAPPLVFVGRYAGHRVLDPALGHRLTVVGGFLFGAVVRHRSSSWSGRRWAPPLLFLIARSPWRVPARAGRARLRRMERIPEQRGELPHVPAPDAGVPVLAVNLAPAFLGVRPVPMCGTFLGIIPGTAVYSVVGAGLGSSSSRARAALRRGDADIIGALPASPCWRWRPSCAKKAGRAPPRRRLTVPGDRSMAERHRHYDICVIGAGSGGLTVAAGARRWAPDGAGRAGQDGRRLPQLRLRAVQGAARRRPRRRGACAGAGRFGIAAGEPDVDFAAVHAHVHGVIAAIAPHDSHERFEGLGVRVVPRRRPLHRPGEIDGRRRAHPRPPLRRRDRLAARRAADPGARPTCPI